MNDNTIKQASKYSASDIKVLKGLEGVRTRPEMYFGDINSLEGFHNILNEVIDNAVDEALGGHCSEIRLILHKDGSVSVHDNGRGIPVDIHPEEGRSAAEVIMTVLHAGAKFGNSAYKVSGGLHGVGVSATNALSEKLYLTIHREGSQYEQTYERGVPLKPLEKVGPSEHQGTWIRFYPDPIIFTQKHAFDFNILEKRFQVLAFLIPNLVTEIIDERDATDDDHEKL